MQEYLIATIQNIKILVKENSKPHAAVEVKVASKRSVRSLRPLYNRPSAQLYKALLTVKSNLYSGIRLVPCRFGEIL